MSAIHLRPWTSEDLDVLQRGNAPEMTEHLGGPETEAQVIARHERYLKLWAAGAARMFVIMDGNHKVGSIGYWGSEWDGQATLEAGWMVYPEHQDKGIGTQALRLLVDDAQAHPNGCTLLTAYPSVENRASNAICRNAGFSKIGALEEEFRGAQLSLNVWGIPLG